MVRAIVGANWGDEGKAKLCWQKSQYYYPVSGGSNAGHTIINNHGRCPSSRFRRGVL